MGVDVKNLFKFPQAFKLPELLVFLCFLALLPNALGSPTDEEESREYDSQQLSMRSSLSTDKLLRQFNLWNKRMVRDDSLKSRETIKWTQRSKCGWFKSCKEDFWVLDYYQDGNKKNNVYKVFVAKTLPIPKEFNTAGYKDMLNMAFFDMSQFTTMVFVIIPKDWKIYQHRFKTQKIRDWATSVGATLVSTGAGSIATAAAAGASFGSIVPGAGTALGAAVGATAGFVFTNLQDDYVGQFLRHIG